MGLYINGTCQGSDDDEAKRNFLKNLADGKVFISDSIPYVKDRVFVSYEEIEGDNNCSVSVAQKNKLGVQVEPILSWARVCHTRDEMDRSWFEKSKKRNDRSRLG